MSLFFFLSYELFIIIIIFMKTKIILALLLFSSLIQAAILKHTAIQPTFKEFSYREVCEKLGSKNNELIEAKSIHEIDCMGKVFAAIEFCKTTEIESSTTLFTKIRRENYGWKL